MAFSFATPSPQLQPSIFQSPAQPSPFQPTPNPFLQQQQQPPQPQPFLLPPQPQPFLLPPQPYQQQQLQPQPQQPHQQLCLFTNDKAPANYNTKWADLHPDSRKVLLQIEEHILGYRDESLRLDQCSRLYDSSVSNDGFDSDANRIVQELGGYSTSMEREKVLMQELMTVVKNMIRNTEIAVRTFMMLRPRFIHPKTSSPSTSATQPSAGAIVPSSSSSQPMSSSAVPVLDFYSGIPKRPSPFLQQTVSRFEKDLCECQQRVEELEQLLLSNTNEKSLDSYSSLFQSLPKVMSNLHDFFVHVAAKVESLHQYIESMKAAYLADQRRRGGAHDPFLEADRRETAKLEAAARRIHPTLNIPAQPSTQVAGLFSSSATAPTSGVSQSSVGLSGPSSGSGFSFFNTPASSAPAAAATSSSIFSTPSASASTFSLFGKTISPQPSTPLGSTPSLFGSAQTPALGAASTPSFVPTPVAGSSLFSIPFASGAATGSGASFGAASKSTKPKSRTARR